MQRLYTQLPDFARPSHVLMRNLLTSPSNRPGRRARLFAVFVILLTLGAVVVLGQQLTTTLGRTPQDSATPLDNIFILLFFPLVALQLLLRIFSLSTTSNVISNEQQNGRWELVKMTTTGAGLTMRVRWAIVFYRLQLLLIAVVIARVLFIGIGLYNLTSYQGRYLDLMLSGTTPFGLPNVPPDQTVIAGVLLISVMMTAALLAPFTAVAFDAALGLLLGSFLQGRFPNLMGQVILFIVRIAITIGGVVLTSAVLSLISPDVWYFRPFADNPSAMFVFALVGIAEGDMGLSFLHLPYVLRLWADRDYGALVGGVYLGYVLFQALAANALVKWAAWRASRASRA